MTPLARALNALERLNARAARPDRQRDPSEPRAGGASVTEGGAGSDGGYDATERAWWGAGDTGMRAKGGVISGPGTGTSDSIPASLGCGYYIPRPTQAGAGLRQKLAMLNEAEKPEFDVADHIAAGREYADTRYGDCQSAAHRSLLVKQRGEIDRHNATNSRLTAEVAQLEHDWQKESNARDQDFADYTLAIDKLTGQRDGQAALIGRMTATLDRARAEVTQLAVELVAKDDAMLTAMRYLVANDATIVRLTADLASRTGDLDDAEARCERLWLQLQEAANVPDVSEIPWDVQTAFERRAL